MIAGSFYPVNDSLSPLDGIYKASHTLYDNDLAPSHVLAMYTYLDDDAEYYLDDMNLDTGDYATFLLLNKDVSNRNDSIVNDAKVLEVWSDGERLFPIDKDAD